MPVRRELVEEVLEDLEMIGLVELTEDEIIVKSEFYRLISDCLPEIVSIMFKSDPVRMLREFRRAIEDPEGKLIDLLVYAASSIILGALASWKVERGMGRIFRVDYVEALRAITDHFIRGPERNKYKLMLEFGSLLADVILSAEERGE